MLRKILVPLTLSTLFSLTAFADNPPQNLCQQHGAFGSNKDVMAIIKLNGNATHIFSREIYVSQDCKQFNRIEKTDDPASVALSDGLCMPLSVAEVTPNMKCLRTKLCIAPGICRSTEIRLTWDVKRTAYVDAKPYFQELHFKR